MESSHTCPLKEHLEYGHRFEQLHALQGTTSQTDQVDEDFGAGPLNPWLGSWAIIGRANAVIPANEYYIICQSSSKDSPISISLNLYLSISDYNSTDASSVATTPLVAMPLIASSPLSSSWSSRIQILGEAMVIYPISTAERIMMIPSKNDDGMFEHDDDGQYPSLLSSCSNTSPTSNPT